MPTKLPMLELVGEGIGKGDSHTNVEISRCGVWQDEYLSASLISLDHRCQ